MDLGNSGLKCQQPRFAFRLNPLEFCAASDFFVHNSLHLELDSEDPFLEREDALEELFWL